jgi:hypothetical protein
MILTAWNFGTFGTGFLESSYRVFKSKKVAQNPVPAVPKFQHRFHRQYQMAVSRHFWTYSCILG